MVSPLNVLRQKWRQRGVARRHSTAWRPAAPPERPAVTTPPPPRVVLRFRDGSSEVIDPRTPEAQALQALAAEMHESPEPRA